MFVSMKAHSFWGLDPATQQEVQLLTPGHWPVHHSTIKISSEKSILNIIQQSSNNHPNNIITTIIQKNNPNNHPKKSSNKIIQALKVGKKNILKRSISSESQRLLETWNSLAGDLMAGPSRKYSSKRTRSPVAMNPWAMDGLSGKQFVHSMVDPDRNFRNKTVFAKINTVLSCECLVVY